MLFVCFCCVSAVDHTVSVFHCLQIFCGFLFDVLASVQQKVTETSDYYPAVLEEISASRAPVYFEEKA